MSGLETRYEKGFHRHTESTSGQSRNESTEVVSKEGTDEIFYHGDERRLINEINEGIVNVRGLHTNKPQKEENDLNE